MIKNNRQYEMFNSRFLIGGVCLLPVLAYPFLPSVGRSGVRCEVLLLWNAAVLVAFLTANRLTVLWSVDLWPIVVMQLYGLVGFRALRAPSSREPEAEDFVSAAEHVVVWPLWASIGLVMDTINAREPGWVALALIQSLGGVFVGFLAKLAAARYLSEALRCFVTRQVSWWHWLPENGSSDEFGPPWSFFLAAAVAIAPLGLLVALAAGLHLTS
ncbi:hypothetical protein V2A60_005994 [Cordyceps javanica]